MAKLSTTILVEVPFRRCRRFPFVSKSFINDSRSSLTTYKKRKKSRAVRKGGRSRAVNKLAGEGLPIIRGGTKGSPVVDRSFQGNARGSGGSGKEATECICPTRILNHPRNFSVDNWLPALEPNGWLTRFNMPSLPRENDTVASEAVTSVTNHVIFIVSVYWWKIATVSKLFNWIRKVTLLNKKNSLYINGDNFNLLNN